MFLARALALGFAALGPALAMAACSSDEERPLPRPLVGSSVDAALSCGELRDAASQAELSRDDAGLPCAVDGIECTLDLEASANECDAGERAVADCFSHRWRLRCVITEEKPDALP